jgi:hypothetical protein
MITVPFDNVPGDVFRLLGEDGLRLTAHMIYNIYTSEKWQKDFNEVTMTALKGKHKATKSIKHHTVTPHCTCSKITLSLIWDECN